MNNLLLKLPNLFTSRFIAPPYTPPHEKTLQTTLLDQSYQSVKDEIDNLLRTSFCLNIITNESENISKNRIINLSIGTDKGIFHYRSENVGSMAFTAENIANWIMQKLEELLHGEWNRINSFATDTCSTMLAVWRILGRDERLLNAHCLFVPCDSHGLQLLIGDILSTLRYENIHLKVTKIINAFRSSPKQLALLRDKQIEINGKKLALITSVITRWGTHARAIESLYRNKEPLRQYAIDPRCDINNRVQEIILNRGFWADLEDLRDVISVIYEDQKMSESDKSHLGYVAERWLRIRNHLTAIVRRQPDAEGLLPIFDKRMQRQVRDIHWAAYYLNPINVDAPTTIARQNSVLQYFHHVQPRHEALQCETAFFHYRAHFGAFYNANPAWRLGETDPIAFWNAMQPFAIEISMAAIRLFKTPANSVPSERSFSAQNFIHNKVRNRLDPIRVDKLTFIYMNRRVLDRVGQAGQARQIKQEAIRWEDLDDEDELEIEDQLLLQEPAQVNENEPIHFDAGLGGDEPDFNRHYFPDPNRHYSPNLHPDPMNVPLPPVLPPDIMRQEPHFQNDPAASAEYQRRENPIRNGHEQNPNRENPLLNGSAINYQQFLLPIAENQCQETPVRNDPAIQVQHFPLPAAENQCRENPVQNGLSIDNQQELASGHQQVVPAAENQRRENPAQSGLEQAPIDEGQQMCINGDERVPDNGEGQVNQNQDSM